MPEVVADPQGEVANTFQNLGVCVVQQCAKIRQQGTLSMLRLYSLRKSVRVWQSGYNATSLHVLIIKVITSFETARNQNNCLN